MNTLEKNMTDILIDLKNNYGAECLKAEFETEGTTFEEAVRLKDIANKANLKLAIKIGGCEAIKDMIDTQFINADEIIAPMIETPYALKKYVNAANKIFAKDKNLFINIETITGFNNLQDIIMMEEFSRISGIILGRDDMTASMDLSVNDIDSDLIFNIANNMSDKMRSLNKCFTIGGSISPKSHLFLSRIPYLTRFETRKVIFNFNSSINYEQGILKALQFEIMWLQNNQDNYGIKLQDNEKRLEILNKRCKSLANNIGEA